MENKEKELREEFAKELDFISDHWIKGDDRPPFSFGGWRDECLDKFMEIVTTAIQQAIAEEGERVRGIVKRTIGINTTTRFDEVVYKNGIDVKEYINKYDFLSSLDITKEDI